MDIPPRFVIHETRHWLINHRVDSALPGYLMLGAKSMSPSLAALPTEALAELGGLQATLQTTLDEHLQPRHLYIGRFGHQAGHSIHFHFIPVYPWVEALFWSDDRYRLLQTFGSLPDNALQADGAELMLYVWREFCERPDPPPVQGPGVDEVIATLRSALRGQMGAAQ